MLLTLLGGAGLVTTVATLLLSLSRIEQGVPAAVPIVLVDGPVGLWALGGSPVIDRWMSAVIEWMLTRVTDVEVRDYEHLLHLSDEWKVGELNVDEGDWVADVPLDELDLLQEGVVVSGIQRRDGRHVGAPTPSTRLLPGDTVVYGQDRVIDELDTREMGPVGDSRHEASQARHATLVQQQGERERAAGTDEAG